MEEFSSNQKSLLSLDLSDLLRPYSNQWVALSKDESKVIAAGMTPTEAMSLAQESGESEPVLTHVPRHHTPHVI